MKWLSRDKWTPEQELWVAQLVINPATNGGTVSELEATDVAASLPHTPALACFDDDRALFLVALWPYDAAEKRGILHVAGTREIQDARKVVQAFLDSLPEIEILTLTDQPALVRMARTVGLVAYAQQDGYTLLRRAKQ